MAIASAASPISLELLSPAPQPWFLLDLGKPHYIDSVRLWNRPGYQDHLRDFYLAVSNVSDRRCWGPPPRPAPPRPAPPRPARQPR